MQAGTVKWFNVAKGFGFVTQHEGGQDVYIHLKVLQKAGLETLEPGTSVNFAVSSGSGKPFIEEITVIATPPPAAERNRSAKAMSDDSTGSEDDFEREWGLRRA